MKKAKKILVIAMLVSVLGVSSVLPNNFFKDVGSFATAFFRSPKGVGSMIPSSPFLSRAMCRCVDCTDVPVNILEVGAGTGPITEKIIEKMRQQDHLDVIEIDPKLCAVLEEKFGQYDNVDIHCLSVLDWNPSYEYDFIVTMLPFATFETDFVKAIVDHYKTIIKEDGILSYVELAAFHTIKKTFFRGKKRKNFLSNDAVTAELREQYLFDKDLVLINVPPAHVYHLKITK